MKPEKIRYKESKKKQIIYSLICLAIIISFGLMLYPINTPQKTLYFGGAIILIGFFAIYIIKKAAKEAACPHCNTELFSVIDVAINTKTTFMFCPTCGKGVKI